MKKHVLFFLALVVLWGMKPQAQTFQENLQVTDHYFHSVFTEQMSDSSSLLVVGSLFDSTLQHPRIELIKVNKVNGNIQGQTSLYDSTNTFQKVRVFDFVSYTENGSQMVALTGSITLSGKNYTFIVKVDNNGNFVAGKYYDSIVPTATHSQGLHIIHAQGGFVVGGFTNMAYDDNTYNEKSGFVLRTGLDLTPSWCQEVWYGVPGGTQDYDMVNHILETSDGYFVTGSQTSVSSFTKQAVLALKLDFNGNILWQNSYEYGNSRDVGVDAYYDEGSDRIYLLCNYSVSHYFGVTVFDNSTGLIDAGSSWRASNPNELNRYAFSIMPSVKDTNNLVVAGYMRSGQVLDQDSVMVNSQTIPFVYEFEKITGNKTGDDYFYHVVYQHPNFNDYFDFWNAQMPLIYYPDMGLRLYNSPYYFYVAYRTDSANSFTNVEMIKTDSTHLNTCYNSRLLLNHDPVTTPDIPIDVSPVSPVATDFTLQNQSLAYVNNQTCGGTPPPPRCDCKTLAADVAAGFTWTNNGLDVDLTPVALQMDCDSVKWTFDDGSNPQYSEGNQTITHTFPAGKVYTVCMVVTRTDALGITCTDSICDKVDLETVGIFEQPGSGFSLWPNPAGDELFVKADNETIGTGSRVMIYNLLGKVLYRGEMKSGSTLRIATASLPNGIYFVRIGTGESTVTKKFVKR